VTARLYEGTNGDLVGFARAEDTLQALGNVAREVIAEIVGQSGLPAESVADAPAPRLIDLAAASRALEALDDGELGRAWREVAGRLSPTADHIREQIEAASRGEGVTVAQRARLWTAQGKADRGATLVRGELRRSRDPEVFIAAAEAAAAQKDPRRAAELYERAIELGGERADAYLGLGRALAAGKRYEQARAAVERAAELDPEDPEPLETLVELWPSDPARASQYHLRAARLAAARFEPKRAERSFERAEQLAPRDRGVAQAELAAFHGSVGNHRQAIRAYERAIERGAADAESWRGLADAQRAAGDARGAELAYERSLALAPDDPGSLRGIGEVYAASGRTERAVAKLERAVELAPGDGELRRSLAVALHRAGDDERALALLAPQAGRDTEAADLRIASSIHAARGERDAARQSLARAVELEPDSPALREAFADLLVESGDTAAAEVERATARQFRGGRFAEGTPDSDEVLEASAIGGEVESPPAADLFDEILATFPKRNPATGRKIARVALTGVRLGSYEHTDEVWAWLAPRRLDLHRFEAALRDALSRHFELVVPKGAALIVDEVDSLQDPRPDPSAIATVNAHFETDAVFVVESFGRVVRWAGLAEPAGSYQV
jgi:tetratricopeptide (TPR) repeat protein